MKGWIWVPRSVVIFVFWNFQNGGFGKINLTVITSILLILHSMRTSSNKSYIQHLQALILNKFIV